MGLRQDTSSAHRKSGVVQEVGVLIDIFPEGGMYGVEWDLLKLVESYLIEAPSSEEYRKLITACPSEEWRETMQARLDNWGNNKQ